MQKLKTSTIHDNYHDQWQRQWRQQQQQRRMQRRRQRQRQGPRAQPSPQHEEGGRERERERDGSGGTQSYLVFLQSYLSQSYLDFRPTSVEPRLQSYLSRTSTSVVPLSPPRFLLLSLPVCFAGLFVSTVHLVPPPSPAPSQRCPRHPSPAPSQPCAPAILQHQSPCTSRRGVAGGSARGKKTGR